MSFAGIIVMAKEREEAMREAGLNDMEVSIGSREQAARGGDTLCAWGFDPSPLAMKVVENVLSICSADGSGKRVVIYACYAGTHSSILAASIHLGIVDRDCSICDLPYFDRRGPLDIGVPVLVGRDSFGTEVYALGTGWLSAPLERAVCDLVELGCPGASVCICAVRGLLDFQARVGGFASRRCKMVFPGRSLIAASLKRRVPAMRRAVRSCLDLSAKWKDNEGQSEGEVIWLDGSKAGRFGPPG